METLANLESFVKSAETGSFSTTARLMSLTPAAVSRNVAMLERNLGVRLVHRSTRKLTLTEAGERLLHAIRDYLKGRTLPSDPSGLAAFDGIVMRSMRSGRVTARIMRNAAGDEMEAPQQATLAFDDPEAMCRAALLGLGVTLIAVPHALPHLESGTLVRMVPQWYADAGPISIYYASRTLVPAKTRVFVDFIVDAFRRKRLAERFAGSLG